MAFLVGCHNTPETKSLILNSEKEYLKSHNEQVNAKYIYITKDVKYIEEKFFLAFKALEYIEVDEDNYKYSSVDGVLYNDDCSAVVAYPLGRSETKYVLPDQCVATYSYAFAESKLREIILSPNMYEIGFATFKNCDNLTTIHIPEKTYYICHGAFADCKNLTSITTAENCTYFTSIDGVLYNSQKNALCTYPAGREDKTYTLPDSCKILADYSFSGCRWLEEIQTKSDLTVSPTALAGTTIKIIKIN